MNDFMDLDEIAVLCRCSRRHARERVVKDPSFPAKAPGSRRQFPLWVRAEVGAYLNRQPAPQQPLQAKDAAYRLLPPCVNLYRHFDAAGVLLYVGISTASVRRLSEHRTDSAWFWSIAKIEIQRFETVAEARSAETAAIKAERPLFNGTYCQTITKTADQEPL